MTPPTDDTPKRYDLSAIIAVGYKVTSERAVRFRKWATRVALEFTVEGFAIDDERLKRGGSVLSTTADRVSHELLAKTDSPTTLARATSRRGWSPAP